LSIRWRLTLWNTLALAVVLLGFAALVYGLLRSALYEQIDHKLEAAWQQLEKDNRLSSSPDSRLRYWADELYEHNGIFTVIYTRAGNVRLRSVELSDASVPPSSAAVDEPALTDIAVPVIGRQRVLDVRLTIAGEVHTVRLMTSLAEVDHELAELVAALLMAVPIAVAFSGAIGYLLARKALGPVEQLRRQTRQITAERLSERIPVLNPGDELGRLTETINDMIGRLELSFTEVRRFTADASHELRTPLAALRAEVEVALRQPAVSAEEQRLLGSILEECQRLTRLTDQLLTLCREDAGLSQRDDQDLDLAEVVRDATETMRPLAEEAGLRLQIEASGPINIRGDVTRLRQVVYNLVQNAIKYTPAGGELIVRAHEQHGAAILIVRDTGVGIPAEHLPRVFDRFYRVDKARSRELGGTGLGLSIARSIVAAHGGTIKLESTPGQGTTCTVTVPKVAGVRNGSGDGGVVPRAPSEGGH
jgi:heavy metal sensor kinase